MDSPSELTVSRNSGGGFSGFQVTSGVVDGKMEAGAVVTIAGNYCSGLSNKGKCVFEDAAN